MADSTHELRAKDLLARQEVSVRKVVGQRTVAWLVGRRYWRPAGCTARLFEAMNTDDPFLPEPDFVDPEPRPLYVADRFVRIDHAQRTARPAFLAPDKKVPPWMDKLRELREDNERRKGEGRAPVKPGARPRKPPDQVHTPSFGAAEAPKDPRARQASRSGRFRAGQRRAAGPRAENDGTDGAPAIDRTPPRIVPGAGQVPQPPAATSGPTPDGEEIDRTPPRIVPRSPTPRSRTRRVHTVADPHVDGIDRTPPKVHHVVTDERGEVLRAHRDRKREEQRGDVVGGQGEQPARRKIVVGGEPPGGRPPHPSTQEAGQSPERRKIVVGGEPPGGRPPHPNQDSEPEPPEPAMARAPASAPPPAPGASPPSAGASGLDDLFGGPPTRVRIGRRKKQDVAPVAEAPAEPEPEQIHRRPPLLRGAVPTGDGSAAVPPEVAAERAPEPEPPLAIDPGPTPTPPPPPAPPPPSAGSLDDLLGTPTPPHAPPSTGGLDDLFAAGPPTRVRIGRRKKHDVVPVAEEPAPEPEQETVDRTPPKIANVDPSKLEK